MGLLAEKRQSPSKKFYMGKIFDFKIFGLKYVLKHFESIPTKKIFDQNFLTLSFFRFLAILAEKRQSPSKKIYTGKNFRFRDFWFKVRFETF